MPYRLSNWVRALGSLEATLVILGLFTAAVTWVLWDRSEVTWLVALPLFLLALNLLAAIGVNPKFRQQLPLLIFHLALLGVIVLVAMGRMTYLKGRASVSVGAEFDGRLTTYEAGPWHQGSLADVRFINEGFDVSYRPGPRRTITRNRVSWLEADGGRQQAVIGDQHPLVMAGYRFYTTHNKGFAPVLRWQLKGGTAQVGDLHLPPYPSQALRQSAEWTPPGSESELWFLLDFDEVILTPDAPSKFRPPREHKLVVREGERRFELRPGDRVELRQGHLEYLGLRTWMGYSVSYDWTRSWLIATALVAVFALGWHLWRRFFTRPWLKPGPKLESEER